MSSLLNFFFVCLFITTSRINVDNSISHRVFFLYNRLMIRSFFCIFQEQIWPIMVLMTKNKNYAHLNCLYNELLILSTTEKKVRIWFSIENVQINLFDGLDVCRSIKRRNYIFIHRYLIELWIIWNWVIRMNSRFFEVYKSIKWS